jgi:catalase
MHALYLLFSVTGIANAACPYIMGNTGQGHPNLHPCTTGDAGTDTEKFLSQFYLNDDDAYMTTDVGGPISEQTSLKAGERGPTLLEDFIFRQKIQRFDHERVREKLLVISPASPDVLLTEAIGP